MEKVNIFMSRTDYINFHKLVITFRSRRWEFYGTFSQQTNQDCDDEML